MHPDEVIPPPPAVPYVSAVGYPASSDLSKYASRVQIAGIIFAVFGVLYLLALVYFTVFASGMGAAIASQPAPAGSRAAEQSPAQTMAMVAMLGVLIKIPIIMGLICSAIAAVGLLGRHSWGRIATIIASIPMLILFPFGTLLAAYAIYLMVKTGSAEDWARLSSRGAVAAT